jgi:hypothetical protein
MKKENSGKVYRFKLDHDLGFGFAEVYDFTELASDGLIVYVYNRHDVDSRHLYIHSEIKRKGIALGPLRLYRRPNVRGLYAWKYLFQIQEFLIEEIPPSKEFQGVHPGTNWDASGKRWYRSDYDNRKLPDYVEHSEIRDLETRIWNATPGIVKKFTMKVLLDKNLDVREYYDLQELGNLNMFVQLVNTYYSTEKARIYLKQLEKQK